MQESSGTRQEKFSVLMCCKGLLLHRHRRPSDRRLDTCTGSPKGARLVPRETDLLKKRLLPLHIFFSLFLSFLPTRTLFHSTFVKKTKKNTWINDCLLHWKLMIHWCLSVLALKVEKSFDDGGLQLTDKSWDPPPQPSTAHPPPRRFQSLILPSYVLECYCYGNPLWFYFIFATKVQAEGSGIWYESRFSLALYLLVCLPRLPLSPFGSFFLSGSVHLTESTSAMQLLVIE